ncbi:sugar ABC transporter substrate-binding protein [Agrobacterium vitis]|uniref:Sugar ABC transporter substrate-binding protein n=1 Tax=Agrobacterium vitis TaxID=373 RepID=A0A7J4WZN5_AGRVI|nr:sugar ABC transporter substrate-binding protein [Agrobacterium vitis]KAA3522370.1 sugar ABC transporter substrate-binding protein [Agrobacterium vitis]MUZ98285.1 substrate-binding domain-containing protein [Agrobacterium vitis]NSZ50689.1 sugar ABC transporter substrate-binding protein [Agrobacterium vitis]UJL75831.1 sugar ABC transporter substrate-binding protein [Agrobacterium vitis]
MTASKVASAPLSGSLSRRHLLQAGVGLAVTGSGLLPAWHARAQSYTTAPLHQLLLLSNEWNTIINDAAKRAAAILGLPYSSTTFNLNDGTAVTQAQSAAAAGAKLFLIVSADGSSLKRIARTAQEGGGYVVNVGNNIPWTSPIDAGSGFAQAIVAREDGNGGGNMYEAVKYTIGLAVEKFGPNAKFLHITGSKGSSYDNLRTAAVKRALAEFPGVTITGSLPGNWSAEEGQKATEDLIARHGVPNGIIAQNDGSLTGVLAALRGLKIEAGEEVLTVGADGATDIFRAIKAGKVAATAFQSPAYYGVQAVARLFDALNGYEASAPERFVGFNGLLVTKDNVDGVLARYVDNPNLPFDPKLLSHVISGDKWDPQAPLAPIKNDDYFTATGIDKPVDYRPQADYAKSIETGEFDAVTKRYADAYKLKLDDFSFKGIKA